MGNKMENVKNLLVDLRIGAEKPYELDEEAILAAYQGNKDERSLAIKIVSVLGGLMASSAFFGFLSMTGLFDTTMGLLVFGSICMTGAIWTNRTAPHKIVLDTVAITVLIVGFTMFGFGLYQLISDGNIVLLILIPIAFFTLIVTRGYMIGFCSVLAINICIVTLIISNNANNLIHLYTILLVLALAYMLLKEAKIITTGKIIPHLYGPIRAGLVYSFLFALVLVGSAHILPLSSNYIWTSSVFIISTILYIIHLLIGLFHITGTGKKVAIYTLCLLILLPTSLSPAISGGLFLILLSFMVGYRSGFILGIIAFIYFLGQYYYDLDFTLLTKSVLLFLSGIFFIALYLFILKKRPANEKI